MAAYPLHPAPAHLAQPRKIIDHPESSGKDRLVALDLLTHVLPILVFLGLQRLFVRGLTAGAVKG